MKYSTLNLFLIFSISSGSLTYAQSTQPFEWEKTVESEHLDRPMKVHIQVPANYYENEDKYRVVYYVDSLGAQVFINEFLRQATGGKGPKLIAVGVNTYPNRSFYFTPTRREPDSRYKMFPPDVTGGAPLLLKCFQEEIIPMVESTVRADSEGRTLMGFSFGGLFNLYTLVQPDQPFTNFIASSPGPLGWDDSILLRMEAELSETHKALPINLYASIGSKERGIESLRRFIDQLNASGYEQLNVKFSITEGDDHLTSKWITYVRGLKWVLALDESQ